METTVLVLQVIILVALAAGLLWAKTYVPSYLAEKGKNLATKEDIAGVTRQIEAVRAEYATDLEKVRAELRVAAHEAEIRFSRLHELRAKAIVGLYRRLVRTDDLFQQLAGGLIVSAKLSKEEVEEKASEAANELIAFYSDRRLFFDAEFIRAFEELRKTMVRSYYTIVLDRQEDLREMSRDERKEIIERRRETRDVIRTKLPALIQDLEGRMRRTLAWISTDGSCPNMEAPRDAQAVKRSVRPFHQGTSTV